MNSTALFSAEPNEGIGYGKTVAAPPWIMIGLAAGCSPMLFSQLPVEARGGTVGVGVGVIMALFVALLVHSAKSKAIVQGVRFYRNGIRLHGSPNETLQPYSTLEQLHFVAIRRGRCDARFFDASVQRQVSRPAVRVPYNLPGGEPLSVASSCSSLVSSSQTVLSAHLVASIENSYLIRGALQFAVESDPISDLGLRCQTETTTVPSLSS